MNDTQTPFADPEQVHAEIDRLLAGNLDLEVLEQAHDVLVRALATVDKI